MVASSLSESTARAYGSYWKLVLAAIRCIYRHAEDDELIERELGPGWAAWVINDGVSVTWRSSPGSTAVVVPSICTWDSAPGPVVNAVPECVQRITISRLAPSRKSHCQTLAGSPAGSPCPQPRNREPARPVRPGWQQPAPEHQGKRVWVAVRRWPDGYICAGCFATACETYGRCAICQVDRLVPGIADNGDRLCTDCAGGLGDFTCRRCGEEGWRQHVGTCGRCVLRDRLAAVLDDGTGRIRPELEPFADTVAAMSRPRSGILWLTKPHVPPILRALARGEVPLTHDGLSTLSPWRSVIYARDLLIRCGVLPPVDRFLLLFEQWLPTWLASIADPDHQQTLRQFGTWHVLRHLRAVAQRSAPTATSTPAPNCAKHGRS